jgi:PAS domain S-box-containing protein
MNTDLYKNENIALFINSLPGAFLVYKLNADLTDELLFLSDSAEVLWGVNKEEAAKDVSKLWAPILPEDLEGMGQSIQKSASEMSFWDHIWRIETPLGEIKWLNGRAQPIKSDDGSIIWQSIILDITELKEHQNKLTLLGEQLQYYAHRHSHDLRSPLAQLMGLLSLVEAELNDSNPNKKTFINELLNSTTKLDQIVREMAQDLENREENSE